MPCEAGPPRGGFQMGPSPERLLEKLKILPPQRLSEVEDFVDFLKGRDGPARAAAGRRLEIYLTVQFYV